MCYSLSDNSLMLPMLARNQRNVSKATSPTIV